MTIYKTYRFTHRDPVLNKTMILMDGHKRSDISKSSGVAPTTLSNWAKKTRRPQFATIAAVWSALGRSSVPIKSNRDD